MNEKTQSNVLILDDLTSLHVTGSDATKFLHAQFTNDLAKLPVNSWQYSGYCTPKGRLLAFMTITRLDENEFFLIMPAEVSEKILPRLRMFVMRDAVTITPQDENTGIAGLNGATDALKSLATTGLSPDDETGKLVTDGKAALLTIDSTAGRYLYIGETEKFTDASNDRNDWTLADIKAGIPSVVLDTQEAFVPQMVNLDLIGAVNFKKGCYPGQEIVARVHYLGKIKQRMYMLETDSQSLARPADKIYIAGQPDKAAGTVVQAAVSGSTHYIQAVLQTKAVAEEQELRLGSDNGERLMLSAQPYSVADAEKEG